MSCSMGEGDVCVGCGLEGGGGCLCDDGFTDDGRYEFMSLTDKDLVPVLAKQLRDMVRILQRESLDKGWEIAQSETIVEYLFVQKGILDRQERPRRKLKFSKYESNYNEKPLLDAIRNSGAKFSFHDSDTYKTVEKTSEELFKENKSYTVTIEEV